MKAVAELLVAQLVPLSCRRREELLRFCPACGDGRLQPAMILSGGRTRGALLTDELPQAVRRVGRLATVRASLAAGTGHRPRHRVEMARTFGARRDPPAVRQRFEMATDGGLRQLHDAAELGDSQLVTVEQQQRPRARWVAKRGKMVENLDRSRIHP